MLHRYFVLNKPYNMVSQFIGGDPVPMLGEIEFDFPEGTHAIGRLDGNSEGLLILTTNKRVTKLLFQSKTPHKRTYLVRVKNAITEEKVQQLRTGVSFRIQEGAEYTTPPCEVELLHELPPCIYPHQMETRPFVPHSWLRMSLYEGKFHQVRKMVNAVGHPCRRLIRSSIEGMHLGDLQPGQVREIEENRFFELLNITEWNE